MTFRELIQQSNLNETYVYINNKDNSYEGQPHVPIAKTVDVYSNVVKELLSKPKTKAYVYKFLVEEVEDWFDKTLYVDVSLLNPRYVAPDFNLKPWSGSRGQKVPPGHYNCNLSKYNRRLAFGTTSWSRLIDTPVINRTSYCNEYVLGEILWELTFYGWTEKKVKKTWDVIDKRIKKAKEDIKKGKYIEILPGGKYE